MAIEASNRWSAVLLLLVLGLTMVASSEAYVFYAGGRDGWVLAPTESYNHWAERNRFQVHDTVVFTYAKGVDSVLLVTEQDYDTCSTTNPIRRLDDGNSVFEFDRSGPFFFISGHENRCKKGQKLYIVVIAVRPTEPAVVPAPAGSSPGSAFPPVPAPTGATQPPLWAPAPEYAQAPGGSVVGASGDQEMSPGGSPAGAPPPTSAAAGLMDGMFVSTAVGVLGGVFVALLF